VVAKTLTWLCLLACSQGGGTIEERRRSVSGEGPSMPRLSAEKQKESINVKE